VLTLIALIATNDGRPFTALEASRRCGISRSTCRAILASLERAGWLERLAEGSYTVGTTMIATCAAVTAQLPILRRAEVELRRMAAEVDCPCTFSRADRNRLTLLAQFGGVSRLGTGLAIGIRFPLQPPYGAAIIAHRPEVEQRRWIERAALDGHQRDQWSTILAGIRRRGVGAWKPGPQGTSAREATLLLLGAVSADPPPQALHQRLVELLAQLGDRPLSDAELDSDVEVPVGYLTAATFDEDDVGYEIALHVERAAMSRSDRTMRVNRLLEAVTRLAAERPAAPADPTAR
jgi:DNA-binding IclR family transcriptional regulator